VTDTSTDGLYEYAGNLHMHTPYSDGEAYHAQIAEAALQCGLDFIVVTDHNVRVRGIEGYCGDDQRGYVLLLTGEEVHDQTRLPQVNHFLAYGADYEVAQCAADPQTLIDAVNAAGGSGFLAHPTDMIIPWVDEPPIPWVDWQVERYTGLEIWNYMSAFKELLPNPLTSVINVMRPDDAVIGPPPATIALWDKLLSAGQHVAAIGNSDAHGTAYQVGPLSKVVFPYEFLFRCVNTHILSAQPFSGEWAFDQQIVYRAIKAGQAFIGYEKPGNTRGFRYEAHSITGLATMGGTVQIGSGVTLTVRAPAAATIKLIHRGSVIAEAPYSDTLTFTAQQPGAYRVEVWRRYRGRARCWILSNPIYVEG